MISLIFAWLSFVKSSIKPGDSCINELTAITHDILKWFDNKIQERNVFVDISIVLNEIWHKVLI